MSERNLRAGRGAKCRRDTGNDFKLDAGLAQSFDLFPGAAKDQRVAALQPHHLQAQQSVLDQQRIDFLLADFLASKTFADIVDFASRTE